MLKAPTHAWCLFGCASTGLRLVCELKHAMIGGHHNRTHQILVPFQAWLAPRFSQLREIQACCLTMS